MKRGAAEKPPPRFAYLIIPYIVFYEEKNVKFADAVMAFWSMDKGITTTYTYDEKDFKRIDGLTVLKP